MEKIDARKLGTEAQQQLRHQAIRLRKAGKTYQQIAEVTGVHFTTICKGYSAYLKHGAEAVKLKKRGQPKGSCRTLTPEQETRLRNQGFLFTLLYTGA